MLQYAIFILKCLLKPMALCCRCETMHTRTPFAHSIIVGIIQMIPSHGTNKVIYLIRHAQSAYNLAEHHLEEQFKGVEGLVLESTREYMDMKFEQPHEDCGITELGVKQCQECAHKMEKVNLDLIICSPMRRALSTCANVFKDHKSKAPIIVDPLFREILESRCDIGSKLHDSMKDYPEFDYSLIKNVDYWYIETMKNEEARNKILQQLQKTEAKDLNSESQKLAIEYLKDLWKRRQEDSKFKAEALSCVQLQKAKLKMLLEKYNSIAVVTHSENIKAHTGIKPPNCSIMLYRLQDFDRPLQEFKDQYL